mmetsp:Transcript_24281/g.75891  ORF Transcript_24281/g.75891 Transcript_24281/m.75891 type:complete len:389 (+) Transcript_24281:1497-2663(+)
MGRVPSARGPARVPAAIRMARGDAVRARRGRAMPRPLPRVESRPRRQLRDEATQSVRVRVSAADDTTRRGRPRHAARRSRRPSDVGVHSDDRRRRRARALVETAAVAMLADPGRLRQSRAAADGHRRQLAQSVAGLAAFRRARAAGWRRVLRHSATLGRRRGRRRRDRVDARHDAGDTRPAGHREDVLRRGRRRPPRLARPLGRRHRAFALDHREPARSCQSEDIEAHLQARRPGARRRLRAARTHGRQSGGGNSTRQRRVRRRRHGVGARQRKIRRPLRLCLCRRGRAIPGRQRVLDRRLRRERSPRRRPRATPSSDAGLASRGLGRLRVGSPLQARLPARLPRPNEAPPPRRLPRRLRPVLRRQAQAARVDATTRPSSRLARPRLR